MRTITDGVHQISRGVDTGLPKRHGAIEEGLRQIGRSPEDVRAILVTHAHVDHVGGAAALVAATGAYLFVGERDVAAARGELGKPPPPVLERVRFLKPLFEPLPDSDPVEVHYAISESTTASLPSGFEAIDSPGHAGSCLSSRRPQGRRAVRG
jgi:glyoxylase-like metal-dependent hydrolase (beta-lactamase superfamily II)